MRRLYWKIFLWVWLTMILIIYATAQFSNYFLNQRLVPLRDSTFLTAYAVASVMVYETEGINGIEYWFDQLAETTGIQAYLVDSTGAVVTQDDMSRQVAMVRDQLTSALLPDTSFRENNVLVSKDIIARDGSHYRLIVNMTAPNPLIITKPFSLLGMRFIIAVLITGLISYFLSHYLAGPIRKLQAAAGEIGAGKLETRVANRIGQRRDEIADLARDFDRMAEQIENLVESQKRLLQDVSHELRTPLARLQVALELARRRTQGLAENELDRIELESERLNELIGEILSLARLDAIEISMLEKVDLVSLLQSVVNEANFEFKQIGPQAVFQTSETIAEIDGNRDLLLRAFENILRNALRYTRPETKVVVDLIKNTKAKSEYIIKIRDYGPGVAEKDLANIFKAFFRAESSRKSDTGGYGLGLAIAEKAIKRHKGTLKASNAQGGGLEIEICLLA